VDTEQGLYDLRPEWEGLMERAGAWSAAQTFAYAEVGWRVAPAGTELAVVTVRSRGELVGLWPLVTHRKGGVTTATHPGCGVNDEYSDLLVRSDVDAIRVAQAAISAAKRKADLLSAYNIPENSPMAAALRDDRSFKHRWTMTSYIVELRGKGDWEAWLQSKSHSFRQGIRNQGRALHREGQVELVVNDPALAPWFFAKKREQLRARGRYSTLVENPQPEKFFGSFSALDAPALSFGLAVDGKFVAGCLCTVGRDDLHYYSTTYDEAFKRFSPGKLLMAECAQWALEHGLDFDLGMTSQEYKDRWASRTEYFQGFIVAATARGVAPVVGLRLRHAVQQARMLASRQAKILLRRSAASA
jgi:CelD/BcsL family acetyltransferase involved in cellulose biosynthesis